MPVASPLTMLFNRVGLAFSSTRIPTPVWLLPTIVLFTIRPNGTAARCCPGAKVSPLKRIPPSPLPKIRLLAIVTPVVSPAVLTSRVSLGGPRCGTLPAPSRARRPPRCRTPPSRRWCWPQSRSVPDRARDCGLLCP